jgi:aryl-alcohol dehydrogenase-like predicted oxidoreductase
MMLQRRLGRTGLVLPVLGFGCGAVGGLMVKGEAAEQQRAIGIARDAGITYFDTAADYGAGVSEINLGRALKALAFRPLVGTKVRLAVSEPGAIGAAVAASLEASLARLGLEQVDLFQLHNPIAATEAAGSLTPALVEAEVLRAFERLRTAGKASHFGFTAIGEPSALEAVIALPGMATAQLPWNALNHAAQAPLMQAAMANDVGVIGIRILAGGALSGSETRGRLGTPTVAPIASGATYADDVAAAQQLARLVDAGHGADLVTVALRFAITHPAMGTALVGLGSVAELTHAIAAVQQGPLPDDALAMLQPPR